MKRYIALLLALVMIFVLCACGSKDTAIKESTTEEEQEVPEQEETVVFDASSDERFQKAEELNFISFCSAYASNKVTAKSEYTGNVYKIKGYIYDIQDDYVLMYPLIIDLNAKPFVSIKISLSTEDIMKITTKQVVTITGEIELIEAATDIDGQDVISFVIGDKHIMEDIVSFSGKIKIIGQAASGTSLVVLDIKDRNNLSFLCYYINQNEKEIEEIMNGETQYNKGETVFIKAKVYYAAAIGAGYGFDYYLHFEEIESIKKY